MTQLEKKLYFEAAVNAFKETNAIWYETNFDPAQPHEEIFERKLKQKISLLNF